jgi:hypothetical protein
MPLMTAAEIYGLVEKLISHCFPGWDFGLSTRFAPYLNLPRDQIVQIFLHNLRVIDRELPRLLLEPLEPERLAQDLKTRPLDFQLCLLDRLLYASYWLALLRRYNEIGGLAGRTFRMPDLLLLVCTRFYLKDEVRRWLSSNSLPSIFSLAPQLTQGHS